MHAEILELKVVGRGNEVHVIAIIKHELGNKALAIYARKNGKITDCMSIELRQEDSIESLVKFDGISGFSVADIALCGFDASKRKLNLSKEFFEKVNKEVERLNEQQ